MRNYRKRKERKMVFCLNEVNLNWCRPTKRNHPDCTITTLIKVNDFILEAEKNAQAKNILLLTAS
jgi:hypothetical protein